MKNIFSIIAIAFMAVAFTSCQKVRTSNQNNEVRILNETYTAEINNTASYTFNLPNNKFVITEDALNAEISLIKNEDNTYNYTPKSGFVGTETIRLSNEEFRGFCGTADMNNNNCAGSKNKEAKTYYNFEIQINVNAVKK